MSIKNFQKSRAFTLVETLIAVTILTLAATSSFFVANNALVAAATSRDRLTASYLAQEGVEYVRKMRDETYLTAYYSGSMNIPDATWTALFANGAYSAGLGAPPAPLTQFTRVIQATRITDTDEKIVSTVSWSYHSNTYSVTVIDHLTPWQ